MDEKKEAKAFEESKTTRQEERNKEEPNRDEPKEDQSQKSEPQQVSEMGPLSEETEAAGRMAGDPKSRNVPAKDVDTPQETPLQVASANTQKTNGPFEAILRMDPPVDPPPGDPNLPHMHTPPYVHHFDTYTLVKGVEEGGFTADQAITAMKAVRGLLALNLDVAKEGLVSKSDVENVSLGQRVSTVVEEKTDIEFVAKETYLFRAACSELRTEITNARKANDEKMRRERTLLQHELDILNQKLTQELLTLKDDLNGMFNDRKMAVRMEQRAMEGKVG